MNADNERNIKIALDRESQAARDLLHQLASDNENLNHDMVEGETSLIEALTLAMQEIDDAEAQIAGCKNREAVFSSRRLSAEKRKDRVRAMIEQALSISDMKSVRLPTATLAIRSLSPAPIYEDESLIPAEFWKNGDPKLDKEAIKTAIKENKKIPGVSLSNGGISLQVRRV